MARTRSLVALLVVASVALILWDLRASDQSVRAAASDQSVRAAATAVTAPLQRTVTAVFAPFGSWARDVEAFGDPVVRAQEAAAIEVPAGWVSAEGRVVAADIAGDRAVVTIDVGEKQGVAKGNAVLAQGGLVGEVTSVTGRFATVRLVTDPASEVGVRVLPSKEIGVATGQGMDTDLRVDFLSPAAPTAINDAVVTLGSTGRNGIPADLVVGTVTAADIAPVASGRVVAARPVAGMTSLEILVVLTERP